MDGGSTQLPTFKSELLLCHKVHPKLSRNCWKLNYSNRIASRVFQLYSRLFHLLQVDINCIFFFAYINLILELETQLIESLYIVVLFFFISLRCGPNPLLYMSSLLEMSCISRVWAAQYHCWVLKEKMYATCIPSVIKCGKRLTSRTLESVRAQWPTVGWPRHRDPCHHLHMRCPLFSLTCQTLSSCAQSICILLRSADCNWFPTMLPRHTHSARPAALSYGGAREVVKGCSFFSPHTFCRQHRPVLLWLTHCSSSCLISRFLISI